MTDQNDRPWGTPFSWTHVVGLGRSDGARAPQLLLAQVDALVRRLPAIYCVNAVGALALTAVMWRGLAPARLLPWLAALAVTLAIGGALAASARRRIPHGPRPGAVARSVIATGLAGLVWSVPGIVFAPTAAPDQRLAIAVVTAAMMAAAAFTTATLPVALFVALGALGLGLGVAIAAASTPWLAGIALLYALGLAAAGVAHARGFLLRLAAEHLLAEKSAVVSLLLREFEEHGADWLWTIDAAKQLRQVSPRLAAAAGRPVDAIEGHPLIALLAGDGTTDEDPSPELKALVERLNARDSFVDLVVPIMVGGDPRWWKLSATPRFDARGAFEGFRGVGSDVTEQRRSAEKIDRLARFDTLTGLANRAELIGTLRKALGLAFRSHGRCALMLIDLDKFKAVNDTLGHPIGDRLLQIVGRRLDGLLLPGELCARLGGDEFAVVLPSITDLQRIETLGAAIIAALSQPFEVDRNLLHIGASVGTAIGPRDGRSVEMLMRNADLALYRAKDDGRGCHRRFEPQFLASAERRRAVELALREALDRGQFTLAYQPVLRVADGAVAGMEALLRWEHPELGVVAPDEFVPIAEEARLLPRIGEWVLRTACAEAAAWPERVRLSINLSAEQLFDAQLPATVLSATGHAGLPIDRLELEVSEQVFLRDNAAAAVAIDRLQALGVRIALDDFGVGCAGLGYARPQRFATFKIDRAFIAGAAENGPESLAIVRGVVAMAGSLGIAVTAEGAETEAEQRLAAALGCDQVQGFGSGRPMTAAAAGAFFAEADRRVA